VKPQGVLLPDEFFCQGQYIAYQTRLNAFLPFKKSKETFNKTSFHDNSLRKFQDLKAKKSAIKK